MRKFLFPLLADYGEFQAKHFLVKKGYKIINTNWRLKAGELDIIAIDKHDLVFVEVKTRMAVGNDAFNPADAVDFKKINKIKQIADFYLERNERLIKIMKIDSIRYDVIGVTVSGFRKFQIEHRIDAF